MKRKTKTITGIVILFVSSVILAVCLMALGVPEHVQGAVNWSLSILIGLRVVSLIPCLNDESP